MRTAEAVSRTDTAGEILFSLILFSIIYAMLGALWIHLLRRAIRKGPEPVSGETAAEVTP